MEPIERFPVVPFPGAGEGEFALPFGEAGQVQQSQHSVVDLVSVTQITFNAEADTEPAAAGLTRSGAGLAGFVPYWAEFHSEGAKARKSVSPLLKIAQPSACRPARGYRHT